MYKDEIINEVWANRDAYVKKHNHDLDRIVKDLISRQKQSDRTIVDRRSKTENTARD